MLERDRFLIIGQRHHLHHRQAVPRVADIPIGLVQVINLVDHQLVVHLIFVNLFFFLIKDGKRFLICNIEKKLFLIFILLIKIEIQFSNPKRIKIPDNFFIINFSF